MRRSRASPTGSGGKSITLTATIKPINALYWDRQYTGIGSHMPRPLEPDHVIQFHGSLKCGAGNYGWHAAVEPTGMQSRRFSPPATWQGTDPFPLHNLPPMKKGACRGLLQAPFFMGYILTPPGDRRDRICPFAWTQGRWAQTVSIPFSPRKTPRPRGRRSRHPGVRGAGSHRRHRCAVSAGRRHEEIHRDPGPPRP